MPWRQMCIRLCIGSPGGLAEPRFSPVAISCTYWYAMAISSGAARDDASPLCRHPALISTVTLRIRQGLLCAFSTSPRYTKEGAIVRTIEVSTARLYVMCNATVRGQEAAGIWHFRRRRKQGERAPPHRAIRGSVFAMTRCRRSCAVRMPFVL
jgi:hypothetical protein